MSRREAFVAAGLALAASGCAGPGVARPDSAAVLAEGKARSVPVYIYQVSWSSPNFGGGRMRVGIADVDDKDIDGIGLGISECGVKGEIRKSEPLFLSGPFVDGEVYASFPSWSIDYSSTLAISDIEQHATSSGHLMIRSITLYYADGTKQVYDKDLTPFLAKSISNFCANAPGTGSLPPSATVQQH